MIAAGRLSMPFAVLLLWFFNQVHLAIAIDAGSNCLSQHSSTGCDNAICQILVCSSDSWCCDVAWDSYCVEGANTLCGGTGCYFAHPGTGCDDAICQNTVCTADSYCCDNEWDGFCVQKAQNWCSAEACQNVACNNGGTCFEGVCMCPAWFTGPQCSDEVTSCFSYHPSVGCDDASCQATVCNADEFCCTDSWDDTCVNEAQSWCTDPCLNIVCNNGGTCSSGTCTCMDGFSGPSCDDYDPCWNVQCRNGGTCSGGSCSCAVGFSGPLCENDIDECAAAANPCVQAISTCVNTVGSFYCLCLPGVVTGNCELWQPAINGFQHRVGCKMVAAGGSKLTPKRGDCEALCRTTDGCKMYKFTPRGGACQLFQKKLPLETFNPMSAHASVACGQVADSGAAGHHHTQRREVAPQSVPAMHFIKPSPFTGLLPIIVMSIFVAVAMLVAYRAAQNAMATPAVAVITEAEML